MIKLWLFLQTSKNKACITTIFHTFMFWIPSEIQIQLSRLCLISATRWPVFSASVIWFLLILFSLFNCCYNNEENEGEKKTWQKAEMIITTQVSSTQWLLCKTWNAVSIVSLVQKMDNRNLCWQFGLLLVWGTTEAGIIW